METDDWREARRRYKIVRMYFKGGHRTIVRDPYPSPLPFTQSEAQ